MAKKTKPTKTPQAAYNQEFRETAVKLALTGQKSVAEVARELEMPAWKLYEWVKSSKRKTSKGADQGKASGDEELRRLQKRNKELEQEVEILKKATA